jgi:hypothetical protein
MAVRKVYQFIWCNFSFPDCDENINNWQAQIIFVADSLHTRFFYYPPSVTLEKGYDLLFIGTGDRENACLESTADSFYCIRDKHQSSAYSELDLVDMTDPISIKPSLDNLSSDAIWTAESIRVVYSVGWRKSAGGEHSVLQSSLFYNLYTQSRTLCPGR